MENKAIKAFHCVLRIFKNRFIDTELSIIIHAYNVLFIALCNSYIGNDGWNEILFHRNVNIY